MVKKSDLTKKKEAGLVKWNETVEAFANVIGKKAEEVSKVFEGLVGEPGEESLGYLLNEADCPTEGIKGAFPGLPPARVNNAVRTILRVVEESPSDVKIAPLAGIPALPQIPADDASFTEALKVGGELKVGKTEVVAGVRALFSRTTKLRDIPKLMAERLLDFSKKQGRPVDKLYSEAKKLVTRRNYAEIFAAFEGFNMSSLPEKDLNEFLDGLEAFLWNDLIKFHSALNEWFKSGKDSLMTMYPAMMPGMQMDANAAAFASASTEPPSTTPLRALAESIFERMNQGFGGLGIFCARGLAKDAVQISKFLSNSELPIKMGYPDKETMLKELKVNIESDSTLTEEMLAQYTWALMELTKIPVGKDVGYLIQMHTLGRNIPWEQLKGTNSGIKDNRL